MFQKTWTLYVCSAISYCTFVMSEGGNSWKTLFKAQANYNLKHKRIQNFYDLKRI